MVDVDGTPIEENKIPTGIGFGQITAQLQVLLKIAPVYEEVATHLAKAVLALDKEKFPENYPLRELSHINFNISKLILT
jgi:hypothetical protein